MSASSKWNTEREVNAKQMSNSLTYRAYKYRIYPNQTQKSILNDCFLATSCLYNYFLEKKIEAHKRNESFPYSQMLKEVSISRADYPAIAVLTNYSIRSILNELENTWQKFKLLHNENYPRFKSAKYGTQSCSIGSLESQIRFEDKQIYIRRLGYIKYVQSRPLPNNACLARIVITRNTSDTYHLIVIFTAIIDKQTEKTNRLVGLDFSMNKLFVASDKNLQTDYEYLKQYKRNKKKLALEQQKLAKLELHSNNYQKQFHHVAKVHQKIVDRRHDYLQKMSSKIADNYDGVAIETLDMQSMAKNPLFGKAVNDNGWYYFTNALAYKMKDRNKPLIKIDRWYPSSKKCHVCGYINKDVVLGVETWQCPICGTIHDRDTNAAINILEEGKHKMNLN